MRYDSYQYLWPPRPANPVPPGLLNHYERQGWWFQIKKNGTCTVIFARRDEVIFKTRHGPDDKHKQWTPQQQHINFFRGAPEWQVFVAELLHNKVPDIRNQLYIFDLLVADGKQLVGRTFEQRQEMLFQRYGEGQDCVGLGARLLAPGIQIAMPFSKRLGKRRPDFDQLHLEDEGFVAKNPNAPLGLMLVQANNQDWQVKSRKPTKNYSY